MKVMPSLLGDNRGRLGVLVSLFALAQALATAVAAFATRDIFEMISQQSIDSYSSFYYLLLAGIVIAVLYCLHKRTAEVLGQSYVMRCRSDLYNHLVKLSVSSITQKRHGQLALRFIGDLSAIKNWVANGVTQMVSASLIIPAAAIVLWGLSPALFSAAMLPIVTSIVVLFASAVFLKPLHETLRKERGNLSSEMVERIGVAPYLQFMGRAAKDRKLLKERSQNILISSAKRTFAKANLRMIPDLGCAVAGVLVLLATLEQSLGAATAAGSLAIVGILGGPLRELASVWDRRCAWLVAKEKYLGILNMPILKYSKKIQFFKEGALSVDLKNIRIKGFKSINFTIKPGEKVLLNGASDTEKTQLIHLIAGLEDPKHGEVAIHGLSMANARAARINRRMHLLSIRTPVLQGSLRRVMTLGIRYRPSDEELLKRAKQYHLILTINRLGGLDGKVFEKGSNLSQSEICQILLMRCSFDEPDLLLIDDVDQYLDKKAIPLLNNLLANTKATVVATLFNSEVRYKANKILSIKEKQSSPSLSLVNL